MGLVANGPEPKAPKNPETNSLDITHDEKRQEKHRIHQFFSSLLADDIADIYRDLKEGLVLSETHQAPPENIIWNWRVLFYSHWGKHAMDALLAIHFRRQNAAS